MFTLFFCLLSLILPYWYLCRGLFRTFVFTRLITDLNQVFDAIADTVWQCVYVDMKRKSNIPASSTHMRRSSVVLLFEGGARRGEDAYCVMPMRSLSLLPRCLTFCLALRRVERLNSLNPKWLNTRSCFVVSSSLSDTLKNKLTRFVTTRGFYSASKFLSAKHVEINMPPKRGRPAKVRSLSK